MATAGGARGAGPERAWCAELAAEPGARQTLDAEESAHLVRSRRVRAGDPVVLFDGHGGCQIGRLITADPRAALVETEGAYPSRDPTRRVRMAIALPEMGRSDRMLAMLAELGVAEVAPLVCTRADPGRAAQAERRAPRWVKLAREACKVNGCAQALVVGAARTLADLVAEGAVLLDPDPGAVSLREALAGSCPTPWLVIGPEGGFDGGELEAARGAGAAVAKLGATALRVETAAVAAAAIAVCDLQ